MLGRLSNVFSYTLRCVLIVLVSSLWCGSSVVHARDGVGWHNGGNGFVPDAKPPFVGESASVRWKVPTASWGNASPVRFGRQVCITEEPLTLSCFDAESGERTWSADNRFLDTLSGAERREGEAIVSAIEASKKRHSSLQLEASRLQRDLRRSTSGPEVQVAYDKVMKEIGEIMRYQRENSRYTLKNDKGIIGYATATPTVSGDAIYALFGNGVLSKFSADGTRQWSVWLGEPKEPMLGYHTGHASSPILVDGVLIAAMGRLRGIEPTSGKILWESVEWPHYGTPAVAKVDGLSVVITPGGELLAAKSGTSVGPKIMGIEFVGPVVSGDTVYAVGWVRDESGQTTTQGAAYRLSRTSGSQVDVKLLWRRALSTERSYATPLVANGKIYVLYWKNDGLEVIDAATGKQLSGRFSIPDAANGSPGAAQGGNRILLMFESGKSMTIDTSDTPNVLAEGFIEGGRSTPLLDGNRVYHRGFKHLYCFE